MATLPDQATVEITAGALLGHRPALSPETANGDEARRRSFVVRCVMRLIRGQVLEPTPEELLWLAVIEHAVKDAYCGSGRNEELRQEALEWIASENFDHTAAAAGLNAGWARAKILQIGTLEELEP